MGQAVHQGQTCQEKEKVDRHAAYAPSPKGHDDIYAKAAPVPDATPSPDRNEFLKEVLSSVHETADELRIRFQ
jgi:hypothetical protein